jgi:hypothetical protein
VYEYEFNKTAYGWSDRRGTRVKTTLVVVDSSVADGIPVESYDEDYRYFFVHHESSGSFSGDSISTCTRF